MNEKQVLCLLSHAVSQKYHWKFSIFIQWHTIVGSLKDKVILEKITDDSLVLLVCHPSWAQELFMVAPLIKKKVNALVRQEKIKHIRFKTGTISFKKYPEEGERDENVQGSECGHQNVLPYLSGQEAAILKRVEVQDLRQELMLYAQKCKVVMQRKKEMKGGKG